MCGSRRSDLIKLFAPKRNLADWLSYVFLVYRIVKKFEDIVDMKYRSNLI